MRPAEPEPEGRYGRTRVFVRAKLARSLGCVLVTGLILALATQISVALDVTEDRRNSFPAADQRALAQMTEPCRRR